MNWALVRGGLLACLLGATAVQAEGGAAEQLRIQFEEATDALDAGDLAHARRLYLEVWRHQPTYDVATNLTVVEFQLGNHVAAADYAREALRLFPPSEDPEARAALESLLLRARAELGTATIVAPDGAELQLDGRSLGTAPVPEVHVAPGTHRFAASNGHQSVDEEVTVSRGAAFTVRLPLSESAAATPAAPAAPAAATEGDAPRGTRGSVEADPGGPPAGTTSPLRTFVLVGGTVLTTASLASHVALRLRAGQLQNDADRALERAQQAPGLGRCAIEEHEACSELSDVLDRRDRAGRWSNATLGLTVGFGAVTLAALVWQRPHHRASTVVWQRPHHRASTVTIAPWLGPGARGVTVQGTLR